MLGRGDSDLVGRLLPGGRLSRCVLEGAGCGGKGEGGLTQALAVVIDDTATATQGWKCIT